MSKIINLAGKRIGLWTVICRAPNQIRANRRSFSYWRCRCDCGTERDVLSGNLNKAINLGLAMKACGCYQKPSPTLDRHKLPEYHSWSNMLQRCTNPNNRDFHHYGGRNIKVCDRWQDFGNFLEDMGSRPFPECNTIERKNNDGNYEKDNCCWATRTEQAHNTRTNVMTEETVIEVKSLLPTMRLKDIAEKFNVSIGCISHIKQGRSWSNI